MTRREHVFADQTLSVIPFDHPACSALLSRFSYSATERHGDEIEGGVLSPHNVEVWKLLIEAGFLPMPPRRRSVTNVDGRLVVEGLSGWHTSDRTLAEYVAAELDRVDPL